MSAVPPAIATTPPKDFASVFSLLKPQMSQLDVFLRDQLVSFEPEIRDMADYCIDTSGKRIRPALIFISGWTASTTASPELVKAAAVVELVHLATLVHDDIMDGADLRRNRPTASKKYGPEASVLLGDALFSHALNLSTQYPTTDVCAAVSDSMRKVCAGEIVQTLRRGSVDISLADYWRIIDLKTAELFRLSCFLGSRLGGYSAAYTDAAARFGRHLGIAYQIYDDLVDFFGDERVIGKTLGTDLASGKLTLPILELAKRLPANERELLFAEILKQRPPQLTLRISQMRDLGVFESVTQIVDDELRHAENALAPHASLASAEMLARLSGVLQAQLNALKAS